LCVKSELNFFDENLINSNDHIKEREMESLANENDLKFSKATRLKIVLTIKIMIISCHSIESLSFTELFSMFPLDEKREFLCV
jgi:hypothetical protein